MKMKNLLKNDNNISYILYKLLQSTIYPLFYYFNNLY